MRPQIQRAQDVPRRLGFRHGVARQADANRVADALRQQRADANCALDCPLPRQTRLGHADVQRIIAALRRQLVGGNRQAHVRRLHGQHNVLEADFLQHPRVIQRAFHQPLGARLPVLRQNILLNRPGVHTDANRDVVRLCRRRQFPNVRFAADIAGIDAQLVDAVFRRGNGKAVVEMDIRHQRHGRAVHQRADGAGAILVVHADAHDVAARFRQGANLPKRRLCVARVGVRHGLHPDRVVSAQRQVADANHSRFVHIIHLSVPSGSKRP